MKPGRIPRRLWRRFEALADHRRRAATVAGLLEHSDGTLAKEVLAEAAGLIGDELAAVRDCVRRILEELPR